jgi:hypothetical protein
MERMIAFVFSLSIAATLWSPDLAPAAQAASSQMSSTTLPLGALIELSPTLQSPVAGGFYGQNSSVITPDGKYMYVLVAAGRILTYIINADGTLTPITSPQAGPDTTGTGLYLANQGSILLALNFAGSSASANTAPFQVFKIEVDGSLSLVPNSISLPAAQTVLSPGAIGSQAPDGSGQYFFAALINNDPSDSEYMTSRLIYEFKIGLDGSVSYVTLFNFIRPPQQQEEILNIIANENFLYIFGDSNPT